jgi:hypothetical protein
MSYDIPSAFRDEFADNFRDVLQQTDSRLMKTVRVERGLTGISKQIEFVNTLEDEEITGQRFKKNTVQEITVDGRWYFPREFLAQHWESVFDERKMAPAILGSGKIITAFKRTFMRRCDKIIMEFLLGNAHVGLQGATTPTALPSGQVVPVDYVYTGSDTDSGMTAPKLIEGLRILQENEAWNEDVAAMGEMVWCVLDADENARLKQQANLANGDRLFSNEFGGPPIYDDKGFLTRWGAVNFVTYSGLLTASVTGASGSVTAKKIPLYVSSAGEMGIWSETTTVDRIADMTNSTLFQSLYSLGGGREQEGKVVQINALA